jgi:ATP-dependent DNA helicase RecG
MLKSELLEIIANGENSGVEFKRFDVKPEDFAKEVVALANLKGGVILLGVEDDGTITGIHTRGNSTPEEWVMSCFAGKIHPYIDPYYEEITIEQGLRVAVVTIEQGTTKPYVLRHNGQERILTRMGTTSRDATREQQARLYQSGALLHAEVLPVSGTSLASLDLDRARFYLEGVIKDPDVPSTDEQWIARLTGLGLMTNPTEGRAPCTIAGLISFGVNPRRYLPQAGLRFMAFKGKDKEYQAIIDEVIDGPLFSRFRLSESGEREKLDSGLLDKVTDILRRFISIESDSVDREFRRERIWSYPLEAVRETIINAFAHRDWTRSLDIEVVVYLDRIEVISPGAMTNSMSVEKMIAGQRSPRNPLLIGLLRDYNYVDARGMGVRTKVIPLMRTHNRQEPIFELTEDYLKVTLLAGNAI